MPTVIGLALVSAPILFAAAASAQPTISELPAVIFPPENPFTESKRALGKVLFWDEQLSSDNTMSCGTCHIPQAGGNDPRNAINPMTSTAPSAWSMRTTTTNSW